MQRFKDIHKGKRIWLLASGPSLASLDVDRIPSEDIIIACNSAVAKAKRLDYACFTDGSVPMYEYYRGLKDRETKVIIFNEAEIPAIKEETYFIRKRWENRNDWKFSKQDTEVIFGYDVVHPTMNFAYILGGKELILCGVDLHTKGGYHWEDVEGVELKAEGLAPGWEKPELNYRFGAEINGFNKISKENPYFKVINASPTSRLKCWVKKSYDEIFTEL